MRWRVAVFRRSAVVGFLAALAAASPHVWSQSLASIPIEIQAGALGSKSTPPRAALYARDVAGLASVLGVSASHVRQGHIEHVLVPRAVAQAVPPADWLRSSFIIDFAEPDVQRLTAELRRQHGSGPITADQVVRFVATSMKALVGANKDTASEVARTLAGDCTEHALLTAALARSLGIPARVVHGAAVLVQDKSAEAYGHAWVEMQVNDAWTVHDAALLNETRTVCHIPAMVISEEGPGYMLAMMQGIPRALQRIILVGP
jgi:hypothetical protein